MHDVSPGPANGVWKQRVLAIALALLATALFASQSQDSNQAQAGSASRSVIQLACVFSLVAVSLGLFLTSFDRRVGQAKLRLDWFLPALRKLRTDDSVSKSSLAILGRKLFPTAWQSDRQSKRRGAIRKALRFLGPSWLQSPLRRLSQSVCYLLFLTLFFYVCWPYSAAPGPSIALPTNVPNETAPLEISDEAQWPAHYALDLANKERIPAEIFLIIDPLVSLSTAIASRSVVWSLSCAGAILIVCVLVPRGFCGYICPLGTTIDLFDWLVGRRVQRFRVPGEGWWVHLKYYILAAVLIAAVCGVLISGFVSAIPVITRGMLFVMEPLQVGAMRGWHLIPPMNWGHLISVAMLFAVLGLGLLRDRFWCKYVCPSGAIFSLGNLFRLTERKVESSCIHCNKCVEVCPFDAIKPDFTTRTTDCTLCQTCGGVCPTHAIKFVERWNVVELKVENDPPTHETAIGRRGFLSLASGSTAAVVGGIGVASVTKSFGAKLDNPPDPLPVRPPGSVPEQEFLQQCIRCGECFKACPNNVLRPEAFQQGLEGLWTPLVDADWAGCESSCNACGQVCPTGAIRALPLEEKRYARMGLAVVNESTCLPFAQSEACDLCVQECNAAGYEAIEYVQVGTEADEFGRPIEGSGYRAPVVIADACVGCGLCQTRCVAINVKERGFLQETAIRIEAGPGKEDRLTHGSYIEQWRQRQSTKRDKDDDEQSEYFIPDLALPPSEEEPVMDDDPFGLGAP